MTVLGLLRSGVWPKRLAHEPVDPVPETGWTVPFDLSRVGEKGCAASTCTAGFGNPAGSAAHCLLVLQALALTVVVGLCAGAPRQRQLPFYWLKGHSVKVACGSPHRHATS